MKPNTFIEVYDRFQAGESMEDLAIARRVGLDVIEEIICFAMLIAERVRRYERRDDGEQTRQERRPKPTLDQ